MNCNVLPCRLDYVSIVQLQVQSAEYKKLSSEELEAYKIEAEEETEKNRRFAETPITEDETYRYSCLSHL